MTEPVWGDTIGGKSLLPLVYLGLFALTLGCSAADSLSLYKSTRGGIPQSGFGDCKTSPYEGPSFDPTGLTFQTENTGYFNKPMIVDHLRTLRHSSGWATWLYARSLGVSVSKVAEESQKACQYFSFLQPPRPEVAQNWKDLSSSEGASGKLLGLYTTRLEREESGVTHLTDQQIMVREDAHRWTLLHEIAHSLFAVEKVKVPFFYFAHELQEQLKNISEKARILQSHIESGDATEQDSLELINLWNQFFDLSHKLHVRGPLEEFAIESMLLQDYAGDDLTRIDDRIEPLNAVAYMELNSRQVLLRYNRLIKKITDFSSLYFKEEWTKTKNEEKTLAIKVGDQVHFINEKMELAKSFREQRVQPTDNLLTHMLIGQKQHLTLPKVVQHFDQELNQAHSDLYEATFSTN